MRHDDREDDFPKDRTQVTTSPGFRVLGSGFRVQGSGFRVQGSRSGAPVRGPHSGALLFCITPTSWLPALQIPILNYEIRYG